MDAKITDVKLNMAGLIQGSNEVNERVCVPAMRRVASRIGGAARVEVHTRVGTGAWARTRVVDDSPGVHRREARTGIMARSLGG